MDALTLAASVAGILSLFYVVFLGQRSLWDFISARKSQRARASAEPAATSTLAAPLALPHNLPHRADFIGREKEKRQVHEALRSRSYLVAIDGIGGIGKTCLALEVVRECLVASQAASNSTPLNPPLRGDSSRHPVLETKPPQNSPLEGGVLATHNNIQTFAAFIWTSAKDHELTLNDVLDTIAFTLDYSHLAQLPLEEKRHQVAKRLQDKSCLLVVDNFETITDQGLYDFLQALPEPSKCLVTSRTQSLKQARAISIRGLAKEEAQQLIQNEASRLGLNLAPLIADERNFSRFYEATGGAPLAIRWSIGQIKQRGQTLEGVLNSLHGAQGDIFEFIFQRAWSLLTEPARSVLLIMPIFAYSASRAAIEAASEIHKWDLDEGLGQLVELWLLEASDHLEETKRRYSLHPLTRAFAQNKLAQQPELERRARVRLAEFFTTLAKEAGGDRWGAWERYDDIEEEEENIFALLEWCFEINEVHAGIQLTKAITFFLSVRGYLHEAKIFGRKAAEFAREANQLHDLAWLLVYGTGWIEIHGGDLEKGENLIREGLKIYESLADPQGTRDALRHLGQVLRFKGNFEDARTCHQRGLAMTQSTGDDLAIALFEKELAVLNASQGNLMEAKEGLESILPIMRARDQLALPDILAYLADVNFSLTGYEAALEISKEGLELAKRMKKRQTIAWISHILSHVENARGNYQVAFDYAKQALEFYESARLFSKDIEELKAHMQELQKKLAS